MNREHFFEPQAFRWGWGAREFDGRPDAEALYWEARGPAQEQAGNLREECMKSARILHERHGSELVVMFSGGLDSEVVLKSFLAIGVKPSVLTIDFGFNDGELAQAQDFCEQHRLPWRSQRFNTIAFWHERLDEFAGRSGCISPSLLALMAAALEVEGYPIFGYGEIDFLRLEGRFYDVRGERWSMARWLNVCDKAGCPAFFRYRAEQETAFLWDPLVRDFQLGSGGLKHRWFADLKYFLYYHHFETRWRPKILPHLSTPEWSERERGFRKKLLEMLPGHDSHFLIELPDWERLNRGDTPFFPRAVVPIEAAPFSPVTKRYLSRLSLGSRHGVYLPKLLEAGSSGGQNSRS